MRQRELLPARLEMEIAHTFSNPILIINDFEMIISNQVDRFALFSDSGFDDDNDGDDYRRKSLHLIRSAQNESLFIYLCGIIYGQ